MKVIENFGEFSGYKINNSKSVLMYLNETERKNPKVNTQFLITTKGFKYLGVKITPELNDIIPANYEPLMDQVTEQFRCWSNLPISMIGRIHMIKMSILPKFLYFIPNTPSTTTRHFFITELVSYFLNLSGMIKKLDSGLDCYIYPMKEGDSKFLIFNGIT